MLSHTTARGPLTDACDPATGTSHTPVNCDDQNACTTDTCDPTFGCSNTTVDPDDGNACTTDSCDPANGVTHTTVTCNDNDACTTDTCDPASGCGSAPIDPNDGDACTTDACDPVNGVSHTTVSCNDGNVCTDDTCDSQTGCMNTNNQAACDDGNKCITSQTCSDGVCGGEKSACLALRNWWPGDGNFNDVVGLNRLDAMNVTFERGGQVGQALRFAGNGRADAALAKPMQEYSLDFWVRPDNSMQAAVIVASLDSTRTQRWNFIGIEQGAYWLVLEYSGKSERLMIGPASKMGAPDHIAVATNGKTVTTYLNGEKGEASDDELVAEVIRVGAGLDDKYFSGWVDELRVFDRALTAGEVKTIYANGTVALCAPTVNCDDHLACTQDACDPRIGCQNATEKAGVVCRESAGDCDLAETCNGQDDECPADKVQTAGTTCRDAAGGCDLKETCSGASAYCPADDKAPGKTVCRPASDICDVDEVCPGGALKSELVADLYMGSPSSFARPVARAMDSLLVLGDDGARGEELYQLTTGASGDMLAALPDIGPGNLGADARFFQTSSDGSAVYFAASNQPGRRELWQYRAASKSLMQISDVNQNDKAFPDSFVDGVIAEHQGALWFLAMNDMRVNLYRQVGKMTEQVTRQDFANAAALTEFHGQLYFLADDKQFGRQIFQFVGGDAGAKSVTMIDTKLGGIRSAHLLVSGDFMYFGAHDEKGAQKQLRSLNADNDAKQLTNVQPGKDTSDASVDVLFPFQGKIYFQLGNKQVGTELFSWDFMSGAKPVTDIARGQDSSFPHGFSQYAGRILMIANDQKHGDRLYSLNPATGKVALEDVAVSFAVADPMLSDFRELGGRLYFSANDGTHGQELWAASVPAEADECPADELAPKGQVCNASTGSCDPAESCTGDSPACPKDALADSTVMCRDAAGACDAKEYCTGTSADCPADVKRHDVCRPSQGGCDPAESCDGSSDDCPADSWAQVGFVCRTSQGDCDVAETCSGSSPLCPTDAFVQMGTICRDKRGACDIPGSCTGSSAACPANVIAPTGTVCRAKNGDCDVAEKCSGASFNCPADALVSSGTVCRAKNGDCDVAEKCSGASPACPNDGFAQTGTVCRDKKGDCDIAETCSGGSPACPNDVYLPAGTVCRDKNGDCDVAEKCSGGSPVCPNDGYLSSSTLCRASTGYCDPAELCSGSGKNCPANAKRANGTSCSDDNACTRDDTCQNGTCVSGKPVVCSSPDQCRLPGTCNRTTGDCSYDTAADGTSCLLDNNDNDDDDGGNVRPNDGGGDGCGHNGDDKVSAYADDEESAKRANGDGGGGDDDECGVGQCKLGHCVAPPSRISYSQSALAQDCHDNNGGCLLSKSFSAVYGNAGLLVGKASPYFSVTFRSADAVKRYLPQTTGKAGPLTGNAVDPSKTAVKNTLVGEAVAASVNRDLDAKGRLATTGTTVPFGSLHYTKAGLLGMTVNQIIDIANGILANSPAYKSYSPDVVNTVLKNINSDYENREDHGYLSE